jgi:hypothetical protein
MPSLVRPLVSSLKKSLKGVALDELSALITQLFGNGEQGAFYIPRPIVNGTQALFQNAAGTVPVTASGDPIGLLKDKSGNNISVSPSVSSYRPTYLIGADGVKSISADGVDDFLRSSDFGLSQPCTIVVAFIPITGNSHTFVFDGLSVNSGSLFLANAGQPVRAFAGASLLSQNLAVFNDWNIATVVFDGADSVIRLNGVEAQGDAGTGDMGGLTLFASGALSFFRPQNNGGIIVRNDRMSSEEISNTENYLASIVGVTL